MPRGSTHERLTYLIITRHNNTESQSSTVAVGAVQIKLN